MACDDPELFLDKKWRRTAKKHHQHYTFEDEPSLIPHTQNPNSSSSKSTPFLTTLSSKHSKPSSSLSKSSSVRITHHVTSPPTTVLRRSSSTHHRHQSPEKSPPLIRSLSRKGSAFTRKCTSLAREQKARFYIMRRCVSMLVRWSKHRDS